MEFKDYYQILGVGTNASKAEIKSAYKKLAKQLHPDSSSGDEEKFKEINEAYEVLKDKEKRMRYDGMAQYRSTFEEPTKKKGAKAYGSSRAGFGGFSSFASGHRKQKATDANFSDFFEMLFGQQMKEAHSKKDQASKKPKRGEDYEMELKLDLEDAHFGTTSKIEITGSANKTRLLEVKIPAHVREGNKIKVSGEGKAGTNGGKKGDLYLVVKYKKHCMFDLDGDDIHSELKLLPHEAILGTVKQVPTLEGLIDLTIPAKTQSGKKLRIKSKGLKKSKAAEAGDHYIHVVLSLPQRVGKKEEELYEKIAEIHKK